MNIWLKELAIDDGIEYLELLNELSTYENVYARPVPQKIDENEFKYFKELRIKLRNNYNLPKGVIPTTTYWIMNNNEPIGYGTIKHYIDFSKPGGHFGLCLKKDYQNKGIGMIVSDKMSEIALNELGIEEVIYTSKSENEQSKRSVEKIGGKFISEHDGYCFYKVNIKEKYQKEGRNL